MSLWLILIIVGVVLMILGFAGVGEVLLWIGIAILVVSLIMTFLGRSKRV